MADEDPFHAHDRLFRAGLSNPAAAAAFLIDRLPPEVAERIDWSTLKLEPGSFVDPDLRLLESDLLFSAKADGRDIGIYVLFEHQSTRDPRLPMRLLRYNVGIWHRWEQNPDNRPPYPQIVSIVVAQNGSVWDIDPSLSSLFSFTGADDPMRRYVPDFLYELIQLAAIPFDAIRGTPDGILVLRILKAERSGELLSDPIWDDELLRMVLLDTFHLAVRYMCSRDSVDNDALFHKIKSIGSEPHRTAAMTLAQKLRQEGRMEGRQDGIQEGLKTGELKGRQEGSLAASRQSVLDALDLRFGSIPDGLRDSIEAVADSEKLRVLLRAAIVSDSIESFAGSL
jgi:predicted transposase YdaD